MNHKYILICFTKYYYQKQQYKINKTVLLCAITKFYSFELEEDKSNIHCKQTSKSGFSNDPGSETL